MKRRNEANMASFSLPSSSSSSSMSSLSSSFGHTVATNETTEWNLRVKVDCMHMWLSLDLCSAAERENVAGIQFIHVIIIHFAFTNTVADEADDVDDNNNNDKRTTRRDDDRLSSVDCRTIASVCNSFLFFSHQRNEVERKKEKKEQRQKASEKRKAKSKEEMRNSWGMHRVQCQSANDENGNDDDGEKTVSTRKRWNGRKSMAKPKTKMICTTTITATAAHKNVNAIKTIKDVKRNERRHWRTRIEWIDRATSSCLAITDNSN